MTKKVLFTTREEYRCRLYQIQPAILNKFIRTNNYTTRFLDSITTDFLYRLNQLLARGKFTPEDRSLVFEKFRAEEIEKYFIEVCGIQIAHNLSNFLQSVIFVMLANSLYTTLDRKTIKQYVVDLTK